MTVEFHLSDAGDDLLPARVSSIVAGSSAIRDQALGEAGESSHGERSARETTSQRGPIVPRHGRLFFLILLAICLWLSRAGAQEMGAGEKWETPALQAQRKNPVTPNESSLGAGQKIYLRRCATCHGKTGAGDGPDAVDLGLHPAKFSDPKLREESDGALFWKIKVGKKPMPDFDRRLSPTDRWNVINFLRTLARG
jgi:mono/diheme cytochrome c family protein